MFNKDQGGDLICNKIEVDYKNAAMSNPLTQNKQTSIGSEIVIERPKPPSGGGGGQAMADANAAVNPPAPEKTKMAQIQEDSNKGINKKWANM